MTDQPAPNSIPGAPVPDAPPFDWSAPTLCAGCGHVIREDTCYGIIGRGAFHAACYEWAERGQG